MSRQTITLKAKPALKEKYQSLLRKDWSMATLRKVLKLLDELLRESGATLRFAKEPDATLRFGPDLTSGYAWEESEGAVGDGKIVFGLADVLELLTIHRRLGLPGMPLLPETLVELFTKSDRTVNLAVRTWVYLDFPWLFDLRGETGLYRDIQSILFFNTVESLLPALHAAGLEQLHNLLVHALAYHSAMVWRDDPAHQQYLLSALALSRRSRSQRECPPGRIPPD